MRTRPRLLFVCHRFPFPMNEGSNIRTINILRKLKGGTFELLLASPAPANADRFSGEIEAVCDDFLPWPAPRTSHPSRLPGIAHIAAIHKAVGVPVTDAFRSEAGSAVVAAALASGPDVVVVDFPYADALMPRRIDVPSVQFTHNVEAEILERQVSVTRGFWHLIGRVQVRRMRRFEAKVLRRYDRVIAVSPRDAAALKRRYFLPVVEPIATGVDLDYFRYADPLTAPVCDPAGGTIVFTGLMNWPANIDAMHFLIDEVWPAVARIRPQARALIVGRNPPPSLIAAVQRRKLPWTITGEVVDIRPYVEQAHVSVIPLRVGSGTRLKAFEAMAIGRPVVSTRVGIEGLDVEPGKHFLAADTGADFAAAILHLLEDAGLRQKLARAARARLEDRCSWALVARQFEVICERAVEQNGELASEGRRE